MSLSVRGIPRSSERRWLSAPVNKQNPGELLVLCLTLRVPQFSCLRRSIPRLVLHAIAVLAVLASKADTFVDIVVAVAVIGLLLVVAKAIIILAPK